MANDYVCSRCERIINGGPNPVMTDKGISWHLCDDCFNDLRSFMSPCTYRYNHQKSEEIADQIRAGNELFDLIAEKTEIIYRQLGIHDKEANHEST